MSSLSAKDRVSLCMFSFADGRRCRAPRTGKNPHFCFDHAQKEARARTAETLGKDLAYFFSGDYLSACDLSTALGRLIPAVLRGDVKPRTARTVAYLAQTLLQTIRMSQDEHINAFGTNGWRQSIRDSVNYNHDYLFPPAPNPAQSDPPHPQPHPAQPSQAQPAVSQPAQTPVNCHSERSEEPAFSSSAPSPTSSLAQQKSASPSPPKATPSSPSAPLTTTGATSPPAPQPQAQPPASPLACPEQGRRVNPRESNRDAPWLNWSPTSNVPPDSKLL